MSENKTDKPLYLLELNGDVYGIGPYAYIEQLMRDYVVATDMYGKTGVEFTIKLRERRGE